MIHWYAFPGAFFSGLFDTLECSGGFQMAMELCSSFLGTFCNQNLVPLIPIIFYSYACRKTIILLLYAT